MDAVTTLIPDDPHDARLAEQVHPAGWVNPQPRGRYDLVVLGAGTAGLVAAAGAAGLGARVALVERQLMGGDCLNAGCVPSKALLRAARAHHDACASGEFGVRSDVHGFDFPAAMERLRRLRADLSPHDSARRFRDELGVDVFIGAGRFTGPDRIEAAGQELSFRRAAVCTGARPAVPDIPGLAAAGYLTSASVFALTELPPRLAVIGAGPIGCELAQAFARCGSRVTLVGRGPCLLGREDDDAAAVLAEVFVQEGIALRLDTRVLGVERRGAERLLRLETAGRTEELAADALLVAVGRVPDLDGLGLEAAGITRDRRGVTVDDRLRTSNRRVYAAGDCCSRFQFTHAADAQARILIANALFGGRQRASSLVIPRCTYTDPEVAQVGLSGREARERGAAVTTLTVPLAQVDRAVLEGETDGFARVHLRAGTDRILGATVVGRHAGETIAPFTLAMTAGLGLAAAGRAIHPYPTRTEVVRKLADAYNRSRLTPGVRRLLAWWLNWRRGGV